MTQEQKQKILEAWDYCDEKDKSTEFMLQYMSDVSELEYEDVVDYVASNEANKDRAEFYKTLGNKETEEMFNNIYKQGEDGI